MRPIRHYGARVHILILAVRDAPKSVRPDALALTIPYLLLLDRVSAMPVGPAVTARQFALARHRLRGTSVEVIFVSGFHELEPAAGERVGALS